MLLRFFIFDCRSSARSGTAFAASAKYGNSHLSRNRNGAITRADIDSFAISAATHGRAFQKPEGAFYRTGGNGRACVGYCN